MTNQLTRKMNLREDAAPGDLARSLVAMRTWTSPKLEEHQSQDGPFVATEDEFVVLETVNFVGQPVYAGTRWVKFVCLETNRVGWLPNQWVDKIT